MGVPAFFRWLSRKYPSVIIECVENKTVDDQGNPVYEDSTTPNPNGVEFDNLYLDMNGIIHPCTHPEDKPPPKNEDEMMVAIFECIDRLFAIVRPRKVLYMAIDGVAPRAKMNQQRSRRFRAAKESIEKQAEIQRIRSELLARGCDLPPEKPKEEHFDSNCITPGTPFMDRLSRCLHFYIHERMNTNPAWKNIKVILSDANVPGEGEHKIMDYIRKQRSQPDHDPNTQHVLCGADADLIMLGLATHEPNFTIIREEFLPNKPRPCDVCGLFGHEMDKCQGLTSGEINFGKNAEIPVVSEVKFIFVRLSVLREYLKRSLAMPNLPFEYDFDRALDDWVFMCFFVGNDFLPHLPSLEIREGAVDRLVEIYKKFAYKTKGYLTNSGEVDLDRVQHIMTDLGSVEDQIFKSRQQREEQFKARENAKKRRMGAAPDFSRINNSRFAPTPLGRGEKPSAIQGIRAEITNFRTGMMQQEANTQVKSRTDSKQALEAMLRGPTPHGKKRKSSEMAGEEPLPEPDEEEDYQDHDEVRLWEDGFKDRYYESKFDVGPENKAFRYSVALQYVRGLCWVLKYYYQGCASWKWYFPYHYAPFASDFVNISGLSTKFEKGTKPFSPLEQLMGVFPAASSSHVPEPWAGLMSNPRSTIIDFYPEDFKIDLNGKKFAWQGVALLPFVDERRLFKALKPLYKLLTPEEIRRNTCGDSRLYVAPGNPGYKFLNSQYKNKIPMDTEAPILIQGMTGRALLASDNVIKDGVLSSPIRGLQEIVANVVVTVRFRDPEYSGDYIFPARRLPKAQDPPNVLAPENRGPNYRPVIGFNSNMPRASLSNAGHRMVNRYSGANSGNRQQPDYSAMAPPSDRHNNYTSNLGSYGHHRQQQYQQQQGGNNSNYNNRNFSNNNNNNRQFGGHNRYNNNNNQRGNGRNDGGNSSGGGNGNWVQMASFGSSYNSQSGSQDTRRGNFQGGGGNRQHRRYN